MGHVYYVYIFDRLGILTPHCAHLMAHIIGNSIPQVIDDTEGVSHCGYTHGVAVFSLKVSVIIPQQNLIPKARQGKAI